MKISQLNIVRDGYDRVIYTINFVQSPSVRTYHLNKHCYLAEEKKIDRRRGECRVPENYTLGRVFS